MDNSGYHNNDNAARDNAAQEHEAGQGDRKDSFREEFKVSGDRVLGTIKDLIREGNVRRIIIKNEEGRVLLELPLTVGVVGTILLPVWAAIGAMAALVANLTIAVERRAKQETPGTDVTTGTTTTPPQ